MKKKKPSDLTSDGFSNYRTRIDRRIALSQYPVKSFFRIFLGSALLFSSYKCGMDEKIAQSDISYYAIPGGNNRTYETALYNLSGFEPS